MTGKRPERPSSEGGQSPLDKLTFAELLAATGGLAVQGQGHEVFTGVSTDSRTLKQGDLFVPIRGERLDGHRFIVQALASGAAGILVAVAPGQTPEERLAELQVALAPTAEGKQPFVAAVQDTLAALHRLAGFYRRRFSLPVVAVTGSVGKTTTKDFIAAVLRTRFRTVATRGNYNNEIGLPLTVFNLERSSEAACFELGMRGLGQIRALAEIVQPTIGVVTNVGETHLQLLGSRENIARAKAELVEVLPPDGLAVLNADDPRVSAMASLTPATVIRYGLRQPGERPGERNLDVAGEGVESFGVRGVRMTVVAGEARFTLDLPVPGAHNASNALAATAVGLALGLTPEEIVRGLSTVRLTEMRLQVERGKSGFLIINDAYNASPASVRAALVLLLESRTAGAAVAVLGDMLELGEASVEAHYAIGECAARLGVDRLVGVGPLSAHTVRGALAAGLANAEAYDTTEAAAGALLPVVRPEDVVLVKGSRGMHMEDVVRRLGGAGDKQHG